MSKRADKELLSDISEAVRRINVYCGDMTYEKFLADIKTEDALIRNLEIVGEAAKNLSDDFKAEYSNVPWKKLAGVRDRPYTS